MLRFVLCFVALGLIATSVGVLGMSTLNVAAAGALLASEGASPGSTCAMTQAFGARRPLCELHTGRPELDALGGRLLQETDASSSGPWPRSRPRPCSPCRCWRCARS